jgi:hypothetical protein
MAWNADVPSVRLRNRHARIHINVGRHGDVELLSRPWNEACAAIGHAKVLYPGRALVARRTAVAAFSAFASPQFAVASAVAFLHSELADNAVYTPLREKNWLSVVALSNTVGLGAQDRAR